MACKRPFSGSAYDDAPPLKISRSIRHHIEEEQYRHSGVRASAVRSLGPQTASPATREAICKQSGGKPHEISVAVRFGDVKEQPISVVQETAFIEVDSQSDQSYLEISDLDRFDAGEERHGTSRTTAEAGGEGHDDFETKVKEPTESIQRVNQLKRNVIAKDSVQETKLKELRSNIANLSAYSEDGPMAATIKESASEPPIRDKQYKAFEKRVVTVETWMINHNAAIDNRLYDTGKRIDRIEAGADQHSSVSSISNHENRLVAAENQLKDLHDAVQITKNSSNNLPEQPSDMLKSAKDPATKALNEDRFESLNTRLMSVEASIKAQAKKDVARDKDLEEFKKAQAKKDLITGKSIKAMKSHIAASHNHLDVLSTRSHSLKSRRPSISEDTEYRMWARMNRLEQKIRSTRASLTNLDSDLAPEFVDEVDDGEDELTGY